MGSREEVEIESSVQDDTADADIEWKYIYRDICADVLVIIAFGLFFTAWYNFIEDNNSTGMLLGSDNLFMALVIYIIFYRDSSESGYYGV